MLKSKVVTFLLLQVLFIASCTARHRFDLKDLLEIYEELEEEDTEQQTQEFSYENAGMCRGAGVECYPCDQCFTGGWCIKNAGNKPLCLCNYGWTGSNGEYMPNTNDLAWGLNRIRADNCKTECHYTHEVRNEACTGNPAVPTTTKTTTKSTSTEPTTTKSTTTKSTTTKSTTTKSTTTKSTSTVGKDPCHRKCGGANGKCDEDSGLCLCNKGKAGPNKLWSEKYKKYYAEHCEESCPDIGAPNPYCIYPNIPEIN